MHFLSFALAHGVRKGTAFAHCRNLIFWLTEMLYSTSILIIFIKLLLLPDSLIYRFSQITLVIFRLQQKYF